ncbi:hypothetical protein [Agrobacterium tumefaciens]|jgi:hypothetical protein|uniref:hypothetical protein n=1 Tax=Agrobacterium tumefaciens TaxID=358 RepID=UPI0015721A37|nr:hypothetical protein [Agrobacterium tumefaciens]
MHAFSFNVPSTVNVTNEFGRAPIGDDFDFFAVAEDAEHCAKIVDRFIGTRFGSYDTREIPDGHLAGVNDLKTEVQRIVRLLGSIKLTGFLEIRNAAGFHSLYIVATEGNKERVYFEEAVYDADGVPDLGSNYKTVASSLVALF